MRKTIVVALCFLAAGCATAPTVSQRRSIESREFEGHFDPAFRATLAVLQDRGMIIDHTDYQAGVIKATSGMSKKESLNATITIEQFGTNTVRERIVFVRQRADGECKIVNDPKMMREIHEQIQQEIFARTSSANPPPA